MTDTAQHNHMTKAEVMAAFTSGLAQGIAIRQGAYRHNRHKRGYLLATVPACADDYRKCAKLDLPPIQMSVVQGMLRANRLSVVWSGWDGITRVIVTKWEGDYATSPTE